MLKKQGEPALKTALHEQKCTACEGGVPTLTETEIPELCDGLDEGWRVEENHHLVRRFSFADFAGALDFTIKVGALAEAEGHHPDITVGWGKVKIVLYTHAVGGLTQNDFILAAKIDCISPA